MRLRTKEDVQNYLAHGFSQKGGVKAQSFVQRCTQCQYHDTISPNATKSIQRNKNGLKSKYLLLLKIIFR